MRSLRVRKIFDASLSVGLIALLAIGCGPKEESDESEPKVVVGNDNCRQLLSCYGKCQKGNSSCASDCKSGGTRQAQRRYETFLGCARGCSGSNCTCGSCRVEAEECSPGICAGTGGGSTCGEIIGCIADCPAGDQQCRERCKSEGTSNARLKTERVDECFDNHCSGTGSDFNKCMCEYCGSESKSCNLSPCSPDGGPCGAKCTSDGTCYGLAFCVGCCRSNRCGSRCIDRCSRNTPERIREKFEPLYECGTDHGCFQDGVGHDCLEHNCNSGYMSCF